MDAIVTEASTRPSSTKGQLAEYEICGRTNAMVACYPGQVVTVTLNKYYIIFISCVIYNNNRGLTT